MWKFCRILTTANYCEIHYFFRLCLSFPGRSMYCLQDTCPLYFVLGYYFKRVIIYMVRWAKNSAISDFMKNGLTDEASLIKSLELFDSDAPNSIFVSDTVLLYRPTKQWRWVGRKLLLGLSFETSGISEYYIKGQFLLHRGDTVSPLQKLIISVCSITRHA